MTWIARVDNGYQPWRTLVDDTMVTRNNWKIVTLITSSTKKSWQIMKIDQNKPRDAKKVVRTMIHGYTNKIWLSKFIIFQQNMHTWTPSTAGSNFSNRIPYGWEHPSHSILLRQLMGSPHRHAAAQRQLVGISVLEEAAKFHSVVGGITLLWAAGVTPAGSLMVKYSPYCRYWFKLTWWFLKVTQGWIDIWFMVNSWLTLIVVHSGF